MAGKYAIIGDEVWDLDIEEPVERLSDTDATDELYLDEFLALATLELGVDDEALQALREALDA